MKNTLSRRDALFALLGAPALGVLTSVNLTGCSVPDLEATLRRVVTWREGSTIFVQPTYLVVNNTSDNITTAITSTILRSDGTTFLTRMDTQTFMSGTVCYCLRFSFPALGLVTMTGLTLRVQILDQVVSQTLSSFSSSTPGGCSGSC